MARYLWGLALIRSSNQFSRNLRLMPRPRPTTACLALVLSWFFVTGTCESAFASNDCLKYSQVNVAATGHFKWSSSVVDQGHYEDSGHYETSNDCAYAWAADIWGNYAYVWECTPRSTWVANRVWVPEPTEVKVKKWIIDVPAHTKSVCSVKRPSQATASSLRVSNYRPNSVDLHFVAIAGRFGAARWYEWQAVPAGSIRRAKWHKVLTSNTAQVTGLKAGKRYKLALRAKVASGYGKISTLDFVMPYPDQWGAFCRPFRTYLDFFKANFDPSLSYSYLRTGDSAVTEVLTELQAFKRLPLGLKQSAWLKQAIAFYQGVESGVPYFWDFAGPFTSPSEEAYGSNGDLMDLIHTQAEIAGHCTSGI